MFPKAPITILKMQIIFLINSHKAECLQIKEILERRTKVLDLRKEFKTSQININPSSIDSKSLFSSRILHQMHKDKLILNIDEWGFTRDVKHNYLLLPIKGDSIINDQHVELWNLILGIFSNGEIIIII